jgi:hypothetical protein
LKQYPRGCGGAFPDRVLGSRPDGGVVGLTGLDEKFLQAKLIGRVNGVHSVSPRLALFSAPL